jgi:hypothetical protein
MTFQAVQVVPAGEAGAQFDTTKLASLPLNLVTVWAAEAGVANNPTLTGNAQKAPTRALYIAVPLL